MNINPSELIIFGFDGLQIPSEVSQFIKKNHVGGVILFKRNIESLEEVLDLNKGLISINLKNPPFITVDQEGGRVARLRGICTDIPALANITNELLKDENLAYRLGAMQARELVALGFNINFAPVCDVVKDLSNNVIGDRAFLGNFENAALLAPKYISGLQSMGIIACAKHFLGHGCTTIDSHLALPIVDLDFDILKREHLTPFIASIKAQVSTIMTAHIIYKALDQVPVCMSQVILKEILRKHLGFDGVVISDDLDMKAISENYDLEDVLEKSLLASTDMFIIGNNIPKVFLSIEIINKLINKSSIIKENVSKSINRINKLKRRFIGQAEVPNLEYAKKIVRCKPHLDLISRLS